MLRHILFALGLGAPFFLLERKFAAHPVSYRRALPRDIVAFVVVVLLGFPSGAIVAGLLSRFPVIPLISRTPELPAWASIPLGLLGADLAMYWVHRLIHTGPLWRIHRWHHAPPHMYWLAGTRGSLVQGIVYTVPPLVFVAFHLSAEVIACFAVLSVLSNHWMHSNLRLRSRWLEAFLVTPPIHHIHHSRDPRHHGRNFGSLFCIWDRLFGTFLDPDDVGAPLEFGIPEKVSGPRMIVGV
jgi:sterol desaturase/sphingolipid hydroxylase (fatty acid hydroxylase superfamily)